MPLSVTVTELLTGKPRRRKENTIIIAMRRQDAGFLKDILRHYQKTNETAERTGQLCEELLERMNECFPKPK